MFFIFSETEEDYNAEVAAINADFEGAVNTPFYGSKINVFRHASEGLDGYRSAYICQLAVMMAVFWGVVELALIGLTVASAVRCKKIKCRG